MSRCSRKGSPVLRPLSLVILMSFGLVLFNSCSDKACDEEQVAKALKRQLAVRAFRRSERVEGAPDEAPLREVGLSVGERNGKTYALVSPVMVDGKLGERIQIGELIRTEGSLISVEASDYEGSRVEVLSKVVVPTEFALHQNYPNPFNPETKILFDLPRETAYTLSVFNVSGQIVAEFKGVDAGQVEISWDANDVASGLYFYKLTAGNFSSTRKMILLK